MKRSFQTLLTVVLLAHQPALHMRRGLKRFHLAELWGTLGRLFLLLVLVGGSLCTVNPARGQATTYSLWAEPTPNGTENWGSIELGVKFVSTLAGQINAIKFYKGSADSGTYTVHLWAADGTQLAEASFTGDNAIGWKTVTLTSPVTILADTIYVASYFCGPGIGARDNFYFDTRYTNSPLYAPSNTESGGNGVYREGSAGFPTTSGNGTNYWVDVVFQEPVIETETPTLTPTITETPVPGPTETPTPAPTATSTTVPVIYESVTLSSGHSFQVVRSVTYGEAAVVISVAILWITLLLSSATQIARGFMNR